MCRSSVLFDFVTVSTILLASNSEFCLPSLPSFRSRGLLRTKNMSSKYIVRTSPTHGCFIKSISPSGADTAERLTCSGAFFKSRSYCYFALVTRRDMQSKTLGRDVVFMVSIFGACTSSYHCIKGHGETPPCKLSRGRARLVRRLRRSWGVLPQCGSGLCI